MPRGEAAAVPPRTATGTAADGRSDARRRPRDPWRTAFVVLVVLLVIGGAGWLLVVPRVLVVRSVVVTGCRGSLAARVRAAAGIPSGTPMTDVDTAAVARRVEGVPQVASARVTRSWPDRVVVAVRERVPVLAVPVRPPVTSASGFDLVDASGVVVRWVRSRPTRMPVYRTTSTPAALRGSPDVSAAAAVLRELPGWLARSVSAVSASNPQAVTLKLTDRVTIVWGGVGDATQKAAEVAALTRAGARYVDVTAPGVVVTR